MKEMKLEIQLRDNETKNFTVILEKKHWWNRWKPKQNLWRKHLAYGQVEEYYLDEWATIKRL